METGQIEYLFWFVSVLESSGWQPPDKSNSGGVPVFGNKNNKQERLTSIVKLVRQAGDGISSAELAKSLRVSRGTITKDMGIVERETGKRFWEDDNGRFHWSEYND